MEQQTTIQKLEAGVGEILERYRAASEELETLRSEITSLRAQSETKDREIERLAEENALKDREIEEIVSKIENILG